MAARRKAPGTATQSLIRQSPQLDRAKALALGVVLRADEVPGGTCKEVSAEWIQSKARPTIETGGQLAGSAHLLMYRLVLGIHLAHLQRWTRLLATRHHDLLALQLIRFEIKCICYLLFM